MLDSIASSTAAILPVIAGFPAPNPLEYYQEHVGLWKGGGESVLTSRADNRSQVTRWSQLQLDPFIIIEFSEGNGAPSQ